MPVLSAEDLAFWDANGYVVAKGVIPREQAARTAADVWAFHGADPDDPDTWYKEGRGIMVRLHRLLYISQLLYPHHLASSRRWRCTTPRPKCGPNLQFIAFTIINSL
jgi:hypothetical protein